MANTFIDYRPTAPTSSRPVKRTVSIARNRGGAATIEPMPESSGAVDGWMMAAIAALVGIGLVMVYSASSVVAEARFGGASFFLQRQFIRAAVGVVLLAYLARMPLNVFRLATKPLLFVSLGLLLVPLMMKASGSEVVLENGAYRWLVVPGVPSLKFQPSEFARFALILFLADSLARKQHTIRSFADGLLPHLVVVGVVLALIVPEPDMGTAVTIGLIAAMMLYTARARVMHLIAVALAAAPVGVALVIASPYRMRRIVGFLGADSAAKELGYQITQARLGIGSGGLLGRGLGAGHQKFFFLPEPYTDSIFSIVGEELGFVGVLAVVAIFTVAIFRGLKIARSSPNIYGLLVVFGLTANFAVYALLNIMVITGIVPATGLPLPFLSYGGTSLMLNLCAVGIILNVSRRRLPGAMRTAKPIPTKKHPCTLTLGVVR